MDSSPFRDPIDGVNARIERLIQERDAEADQVAARHRALRREVRQNVSMWSALTTSAIALPSIFVWRACPHSVVWWMVLGCFAFTLGVPWLVGALIVAAATRRHGAGAERLRRTLARTGDAYRDLARVTPPLDIAETRGEAGLHALARSGWLTILGLLAFEVLMVVVVSRYVR
jgi:hypothetical protein